MPASLPVKAPLAAVKLTAFPVPTFLLTNAALKPEALRVTASEPINPTRLALPTFTLADRPASYTLLKLPMPMMVSGAGVIVPVKLLRPVKL